MQLEKVPATDPARSSGARLLLARARRRLGLAPVRGEVLGPAGEHLSGLRRSELQAALEKGEGHVRAFTILDWNYGVAHRRMHIAQPEL